MSQLNNGDNFIRVAHRGLFSGPDLGKENTVEQIRLAISKGFWVEIDAWLVSGKWYLGHDYPKVSVSYSFFTNPFIFTHCKNIEAYNTLKVDSFTNVFLHEDEDYCITSKGYKWNHIKNWPHIFSLVNNEWKFVGAYSKLW